MIDTHRPTCTKVVGRDDAEPVGALCGAPATHRLTDKPGQLCRTHAAQAAGYLAGDIDLLVRLAGAR